MTRGSQSTEVVCFNTYEVHLHSGELYKAGHKIRLQDLPFQVLARLLEHAGEVVSRKDLEKQLWPEGTFVDFEHSLNTAIKKLRQALSDDSKQPQFIETLPKRGYRFVGTVERRVKPLSSGPPATPVAHAANTNSGGGSSWIGRVARVRTVGKSTFLLVAADEESAIQREKLDAAKDDVGLSLLIAAQRVFLVHKGTPARILEVQETASRCLVRILEGEHYGKTALVPLNCFTGLA